MNGLREEIKKSMSGLTKNGKEKTVKAHFLFSSRFSGFQGHFPGRPILPGICKIQAVLVMFQAGRKKRVRLKEIVQAKFFSPALPDEELIFECREEKQKDGQSLVKAVVSRKKKKIAGIHLRVVLEK